MAPVKDYDYYGAYETPLNENDTYKKYLNLEYSFEYPPNHENVSAISNHFVTNYKLIGVWKL